MRRHAVKGATVLLSAGALFSLGMSPASADGGHRHGRSHDREIQQTVNVVGNGSSVRIDHATIYAGSIRFAVRSTNASGPDGGGSAITMFRPKAGKTVSRVLHDLADEFGPNPALGTRELTADTIVRGLADVVPGSPEVVTENVYPGTYYLMDLGNFMGGAPKLTTLKVRPAKANIEQDSDLVSQTTVSATSADRFVGPRNWPHKGTYTFRNTSDTLHFMEIAPVKAGTTDRQVSAYFKSAGPNSPPPPFMRPGPSGGNDVVSPGRSLQVTYNLPRGTYVLLCFVADDKTGMPHAIMGMHKVVVLH
jgi:hypothetical protein